MKSNIKRWGIGVFVVAIICLFASLCLLSTIDDKNSILADSTINDEQKANVQDNIPEISETIELNGADLAAQSAKWSTAVESALTGKHVLVKLINNWTANADGFVAMDVTGFSNKIIYVPTGTTITIDLNGRTINRNLVDFRDNGSVMEVNGTLIIKDSAYDSQKAFDFYNNSWQGNYTFYDFVCGKIRGGRNNDSGGGIKVLSGNFIMEGGMLMDNKTSDTGGAIYADNSNVIIKDGIIYYNIATGKSTIGGGGAISIDTGTKFDFYNGIIHSNSATKLADDDGGAIVMWSGECNIYDGIFSHNYAEDGAGFMVSRNGTVNITGGRFEYNTSNYSASCFYFAEGTESASITNAYIANNATVGIYAAILGSLDASRPTKLYISDTVIKDNTSGKISGAIGQNIDITLGKNVQIHNNFAGGKSSDVELSKSTRLNCSEDLGDSKIGITIENNYTGGDVVASDYTTYNSKEPYNYFFSNQYASIATTKGSDVVFDKTISGGSYDFVYLESGKRVNYKDTEYIHTTNDFELRKNVNAGLMVLGSISCGTSVNSFLQNLNFAGNRIKLYNNQNNVIYDYSNSQTGYNHLYDDGVNLAIGTGWYLEVYSQLDSVVEKVYLSVLGDVTGDGKVNALDVNYLRRIISNPTLYASLNDKPYIQLSALIINNGKLTNADGEILWNIVCGRMDIIDFI